MSDKSYLDGLLLVLVGHFALVELLVLLVDADGRVDEGQLGLSRATHLGFCLIAEMRIQ
jgi:hypothetical protein